MRGNNKHIAEDEFKRYLANEMSNEERNKFERLLQKHPFEAEALEGMLAFSYKETGNDLADLRKKLNPNRRRTFPYWIAAASFLIIISTGIIFYLTTEAPINQMAEVKIPEPEQNKEGKHIAQERQLDEAKSTPISPPIENKKSTESAKVVSPPITSSSQNTFEMVDSESEIIVKKIVSEDDINKSSKHKTISKAISPPKEKMFAQGIATTKGKTLVNTARERVISSDDDQPLPGVNIVVEGTTIGTITNEDGLFKLKGPIDTNTNFKASFVGMESAEFKLSSDTENILKMQEDQAEVQEVVAIGYGTQKKSDLTGSVSIVEPLKDRKAYPNGGFEEYEKYLQEKCILPDGVEVKKKVVKIILTIDSTGAVSEITPVNSPDSTLFELTKEIIFNGPDWQAEVKDGKVLPSDVDFKMRFTIQN